jgi:hypothetical protein
MLRKKNRLSRNGTTAALSSTFKLNKCCGRQAFFWIIGYLSNLIGFSMDIGFSDV